jgi:hypothetical protein
MVAYVEHLHLPALKLATPRYFQEFRHFAPPDAFPGSLIMQTVIEIPTRSIFDCRPSNSYKIATEKITKL